jgi:hypothetical protein
MIRIAHILIALITVSAVAVAAPRKQSTSHGRLHVAQTAAEASGNTATADTISVSSISISGYDKPVNASKETFLVVNHTDRTITELTVTFTYSDMQGRQLHKATHTVSCDIAPRETKMTAVPSWDRQRSFYYFKSASPRKQATPYNVSHRIDCVLAEAE